MISSIRMLPAAVGVLVVMMASVRLAHASNLELSIRHSVNGTPMALDSLRYQNSAEETFSITRLSYLLSGFAVERDDGEWFEAPDQTVWIDVQTHRTSFRITGVPDGKYRAMRFHIGPDATANNGDVSVYAADHPLNPNLNGLHWSWQGGYIFLALEGHFRKDTPDINGYAYHLARDPNRTRVSLAVPIDLTNDTAVGLDFDVGTLLNAPRPISFAKDGTATHSRENDPVAAALVSNLPGAFHVTRVASSKPALGTQSAVKPLHMPESYTPYRFTMSGSFPIPDLPRDNPLIEERVELGKALFNETALSRDRTVSCASCHEANHAFTDAKPTSTGVDGRTGTRNAMPLFNLAWKSSFFWDGRAKSLREQALIPIQDHREMDESLDAVTRKLSADPVYQKLFSRAFGSPEITPEKIGLAIEQFLITLTSYRSRFDLALRGKAVLTDQEKRGFELFMTEYEPRTGQTGADCFHCHGGALFSDNQFHNNGLEQGADTGRFGVTGNESDRGKFATPSLRNVSRTAPYMHDGRFTTLEQVVAHYSSGVHRSATLDPNLAKHPAEGLKLSETDQKALVAFLKCLADE